MSGNKLVTIGGVRFDSGEINSKYLRIKKNNNTTYQVTLKNGVKIEYPEQEIRTDRGDSKKPSIYMSTYKQGNDTINGTFIYGLNGGNVKGSNGKDVIHTNYQCEQNKIDVSGDNASDEVLMPEGSRNTVVLGKKDKAEINHKTSYGFGIFRQPSN